MKNKKIILAFLLFGINFLSAQKISINIAADFFKDANKSVLVISDELGKILYETLLIEGELTENFSREYERYLRLPIS